MRVYRDIDIDIDRGLAMENDRICTRCATTNNNNSYYTFQHLFRERSAIGYS
jgi:hypothetical protein